MSQRALLTGEQIQMYEYLGLSVSNFNEVCSEPSLPIESENENDFEEMRKEDPEDAILSSDDSSHVNNYNNELVKKDNIISPLKNVGELQDESSDVQQVKRPFLKRGVGLTNRFRIPPDAFNLKKLPRYKYADRVKKNLVQKDAAKLKTPIKDHNEPERRKTEPIKKKEPPLASNPEKRESLELGMPPTTALKIPSQPIALPSVSDTKIQDWFNSRSREQQQPEISETPKLAKLPKGVSWAQILSSNNIADSPINVDHLLNPQNLEADFDLNETSLFHLLEERVNNMSLDTSMSSIMKLLASLKKPQSSEDNEATLVNPEDPIIDAAETVKLQLEPHPMDVKEKIIIDETSDDNSNNDNEEDNFDDDENHVRFSDNVEVVQDESHLSTDIETIELSMTSTPNERQHFQNFKRKLLGYKNVPEERSELKEKSDLLKTKLSELETEINSLREQTASVAKIRQDLEIDRLQLENDREDMEEQLKDDRIKMELKLHDERLKVEQEKQKHEKMLKNPSKKEREEIAKLKETVDDLREELKAKEARHGSASARYRSQIKQLEKENQTMKLELDVIKKDNKKLELENARLRKDTNNKMLQEINRNIAKLAPAEVKKQPEVAKPVMRKSDPTLKKRVKSVPVLNVQSSSDSSDIDQVSSYNSYKQSKENNPVKVRRSDPVKLATISSSSDVLAEMKREIVNSDGSKDIWYPNGNLKKISPDGMLIRMLYFNKDIKEQNMNEGTIKYYYNETNTWHTTYIDGLEILEYPE